MSNYSDQVKADAKAAADYIREHGWIQKRFGQHGGPRCAYGVMCSVLGRAAEEDPLRRAFNQETGRQFVVDFNDEKGRTKDEVLAVFDRIAGSNQPPEGRDKVKP